MSGEDRNNRIAEIESELQPPPGLWNSWLADILRPKPYRSVPAMLALSDKSLVSTDMQAAVSQVMIALEWGRERSVESSEVMASAGAIEGLRGGFPTLLLISLTIESLLAGVFYSVFVLALTGAVTALPALPAFSVAFASSGLAVVNAKLIGRWWNRR